MVEIIASIVFVGSVAGAGSILVRKMPQAIKSVEAAESSDRFGWRVGFAWLLAKIKQSPRLKDFSWLDFLQKRLLKIRVAVLKIDNKINEFAAKLRQRAEKQRHQGQAPADDYWRDLRTIIKTKQLPAGARKTKIVDNPADPEIVAVSQSPVEAGAVGEDAPMIKRSVTPEQSVAAVKGKKKRTSRKKKSGDPFAW